MIQMNERRVKQQIAWQRARARQAGVESTLTAADWIDILDLSGGACHYCHRAVGHDMLVIEHALSITRGGGNTRDNVVAACARCNHRKGPRANPNVERIEVTVIEDDEVLVELGGHQIRMFSREALVLLEKLTEALVDQSVQSTPDTTPAEKPKRGVVPDKPRSGAE